MASDCGYQFSIAFGWHGSIRSRSKAGCDVVLVLVFSLTGSVIDSMTGSGIQFGPGGGSNWTG